MMPEGGAVRRARLVCLAVAALSGGAAVAQDATPNPQTTDELVRTAERRPGLIDMLVDDATGRLWLVLPEASGEAGVFGRYLHVVGLSAGLGSNPLGLDRGLLGATRLIELRRLGDRLFVEQVNLAFRATTEDLAERRALRESFARSVLWTGSIVSAGDGEALVDFTSFVVRDALGVGRRLEDAGQGDYRLDVERSAVAPEGTLSFPDNLELEAVLTWTVGKAGALVGGVAADPHAITLTQHQSILRLPDDGYRPRRFDPRAGSYAVGFKDYAVPLDRSIDRAWIVRHRLRKTDPSRARSTVEEPIVYYVDRGVPEPVRSALLDGARWWAEAFDAAGFVDAFRVELLPEGVHPLDARYNVIEWVHRSTRGWSYGGGIVDPRTGEMIKGHVRLGSLRVRQDRLLFEGLAGTEATGTGGPDDPVNLALARIRQLSAHEVGHALGLVHNFAASTYADRASVMDYPAPLIGIDERGELDFSKAYGVGVGVWDRLAIDYAYAEFPPGADEEAALAEIVERAIERGWVLMSDDDARPAGAAHPLANLWDNGSDPVAELAHTLRVRRIALDRFGERNVRPGEPLALLEEVLVPLYLHHRYQLEAAVKSVGGYEYAYALRGDSHPPARPVDAARQLEALDAVLETIDPQVLELDPRIVSLIPPRPPGFPPNREQFAGATDPLFDPLAAAATAADMAVAALLEPQRAARMIRFHAADPALPGFETVVERLVARVFADEGPRSEVRDTVQRVVVARTIRLASDPETPELVVVRLQQGLERMLDRLRAARPVDAHRRYLVASIERYLDRPGPAVAPGSPAPPPPPGSPIGTEPPEALSGCSRDRPLRVGF